MARAWFCWPLLAALVLPACGNADDRPSRGARLPAGGGSGGTETGQGGGAAGEAPTGGGEATGGSGELDAGDDAPEPDAGHECIVDPLSAGSNGTCVTVGAPGYRCNPVTGYPCQTASGETCEYDGQSSGFACQALAGDTMACRKCDFLKASCQVGFTCLGTLDHCTRYCCVDGDCGPGAQCVAQPPTTLGICQATPGAKLADFGWKLPGTDAGHDASDAAVDGATDAAPPTDCAGCSALECTDRERACRADSACVACIGTDSPADTCLGLMSWQVLLACRCDSCPVLCPGSCR